jgi:putative colanic acid biosynthesis glycosyltransferase WcaI
MRILNLGINYWPEATGIACFATGRCEYLVTRGHEVTVHTGFPYYPQWRIPEGYRRRLALKERRNGVSLVRSWLYVPNKVTSVKRILHEASFIATSSISVCTASRPDIIVATMPPLGLGAAARLLSRFWKIPYVLLVEDLQPDTAIDLGMIKPGRMANMLFCIERLAYRNASIVATLTNGMARRIMDKGISPSRVRMIPHWIDESILNLPFDAPAQPPWLEFASQRKFLVVHAGNMGVKQGLDVVLEAAALSKDNRDITYLLVGDGAEAGRLKAKASQQRLTNLSFFPLQPRAAFENLLSLIGVGLVTQQSCVSDIVFPSKMETLLAAGSPVIASVNQTSEVAETLRDAQAGIVVNAGDAASLARAVDSIYRNPERRNRMRRLAREYASRRWNRKANLGLFESSLIGSKGWPRLGPSFASKEASSRYAG